MPRYGHPWRRGASAARNLIALVALLAIAGAIVFVLNRPSASATILSRELTLPMAGTPLAERFALDHMLLIAEIRNDGGTGTFDIEGIVRSGSDTWREATTINLDAGERTQVVLDFGVLEFAGEDVEYEITAEAR